MANEDSGKLVLALTLFGTLVFLGCTDGAGSNSCSYGPSYWCDSLPNAKKCNAMRHCIQTVWEKKKLPTDNDDICTICKDMVRQARDTLLSNETQDEIRQVFEGSCNLIPIKIVREECIKLSDDFIPELIETLASQMDPQVVCAVSGLCNSIRIDKLLSHGKGKSPSNKLEPLTAADTKDCDDCKTFVDDLVQEAKTASKSDIEQTLMAICGRLGSLSDGCMALIEVNLDRIYTLLTQQLNSEDFCNLVGMCHRMYENIHSVKPWKKSGDETCDFCEAIVQHWKDTLISNTTEQEFKQILEGLCRQTRSYQQQCLSLVEEYYETLYNVLVSEMRPKEMCEAVGLCQGSVNYALGGNKHPVWVLLKNDKLPEKKKVPLTRLQPAVKPNGRFVGDDEAAALNPNGRFVGNDEAMAHHPHPHLPKVKLHKSTVVVSTAGERGVITKVKDDQICAMCEFAMQYLQTMLEDKNTREQIKNAVDHLCEMMPKTVAEQCEDYVDAYGDQLIELLVQEMDPEQICGALHLCPPKNPTVVGVKQDVTCVICEFAMTKLENMLKDNKTESNIRKALEKVCSLLPKNVRSECESFVEVYTDQVIQMLIDNLSPDEVCSQLGLCDGTGVVKRVKLNGSNQLPVSRLFVPGVTSGNSDKDKEQLKINQSPVCILCELIMVKIDHIIVKNATVDEVVQVVDFICAHLPSSIQEDCISFVDQYGQSIIEILAHSLDPETVCRQLSLCKQTGFGAVKMMVNMESDKCSICESVVDYVYKELNGDSNAQIEEILERACTVLPQKDREFCNRLAQIYGPYLVNLLKELAGDSKKVCQVIRFCPKFSDHQLLGAEKCTWGPSYWCQTQVHAQACKAMSHCEERVWKGKVPSF